jgi:hypothetical protein
LGSVAIDNAEAIHGSAGVPAKVKEALAGAEPPADDFTADAPKSYSEMEDLARATLRHIMLKSPQDAPRVAAAREVILRAEQERETRNGVTGKKAAQRAVVEEMANDPSSRFALKPAPGRMQ